MAHFFITDLRYQEIHNLELVTCVRLEHCNGREKDSLRCGISFLISGDPNSMTYMIPAWGGEALRFLKELRAIDVQGRGSNAKYWDKLEAEVGEMPTNSPEEQYAVDDPVDYGAAE